MRPLCISKFLNLPKPVGKHNVSSAFFVKIGKTLEKHSVPPGFFVEIGKALEKHEVPLQFFMKIRRIQEEYYTFPRVPQYSIFQGYIMFLLCSERVL
jgi:hypothetical protein